MEQFGILRALVLASLVFLLAACGGEDGDSASSYGLKAWADNAATGAEVGQRAPNFLLETADRATVELAALNGAPVVINFFASWCQNCREEMTALEAIRQSGVQVVGIDLREKPEVVTSLANETGAAFPLALDRNGEVTRSFKVVNLPATVIVDGTGVIRTVFRGPVTEQDVRDALARM